MIVTSGRNTDVDSTGEDKDALYVVDFLTGNKKVLVNIEGSELWPAWSPDGRLVAFVKNDIGTSEMYVFGIQDEILVRVAGDREFAVLYPARWTSDSLFIEFDAINDKNEYFAVTARTDGSVVKVEPK